MRALAALLLLLAACSVQQSEVEGNSKAQQSEIEGNWTRDQQEQAIGEVNLHCLFSFSDDPGEQDLCSMLAVESLIAAQEAGTCSPGEAVEAIKGGVSFDVTEKQAQRYLFCTGG